jgi:hypothetical protein
MTQTLNRAAPAATRATRTWGRRAITLGLAVAAGLAVWLVSDPLLGIDLSVGTGETARTVGPPSIVVAALLAGGAGWALLALLERRLPRGRRVWRVTAWTVLVLSLLGPVSAGATGGVFVSLIAMHVAVGATLALGLAGRAADDLAGRAADDGTAR